MTSNNQAPKQTRLSVNIGEPTTQALETYAARHGVSVTEALCRLVAYGELVSQADDDGKTLLLSKDGVYERIVLI